MPATESAVPSELSDAPDLETALTAIEQWLREQSEIDGYFINLYQPEDHTLRCVRAHLPPAFAEMEKTYTNYAFPADSESVSALAFARATKIATHISELDSLPALARIFFERMQLREMVVLPIQSTSRSRPPAGTITLLAFAQDISPTQLERVELFVAAAAPLIRLHGELASWQTRAHAIQNAESDLKSLLGFIAEVSNLTTDHEIYQRIEKEFLRRFSMDIACVLLVDNNTRLKTVDTLYKPADAPWGPAWKERCKRLEYSLDAGDGAGSHVFVNNSHLCFGDIPAIRNLQMSDKDRGSLEILADLQTLALFPIRKYGRPIGVLMLCNMSRKNALTAEQQQLIQHLCDFLGSTIENAQTYTLVEEQRRKIEMLVSALQDRVEVLDHLASRDRLTGLFNFGSFEAELKKRLALYQEQIPQSPPLSIIMCDVDYFKRFNDTFGHVAGNDVLQEVASRIAGTVRDSDYVARYGGEEFAILLGRCNLDVAAKLAERIRENIAKDPFRIDGADHAITISLGCAEIRASDDAAGFIARADTALYVAKQNGRNRVEISN